MKIKIIDTGEVIEFGPRGALTNADWDNGRLRTSQKTREYWAEKAIGWAEGFLLRPDFDGTPQLDEFRAVMDDLLDASRKVNDIAWLTDKIKAIEDREKTQ